MIDAAPGSPTFYRRPLPDGLVAFASPEGRALFREALARGGMEGWFPLAEHFHTQAEPAFCALGTLVMVLNALSIDPARAWKGPWRWYAEDLLDCCDPLEVVRTRGLTLPRFACLARCNGATAAVRYAADTGVDALRADLVAAGAGGPTVIASFDRAGLGQTGEGHYSPIGGYHPGADLALVLDVARFKYPPFWVPVSRLHAAMVAPDRETGRSRGWVVLDRDGTWDTQVFRIACETPGWQTVVDDVRARLPRVLAEVRPGNVAALMQMLAASIPVELQALVEPRQGAPVEILADLRASPLAAAVPMGDVARLVLFALSAPDAAWGGLDPRVREELDQHRNALPVAARGEVDRLRAQLDALSGP
ncbi:MAG: phytochelatin synthase family protein [Pseudomonadota bacterium]|nr:phytochelatin synthase family protein [Pseudomonadota bacterium]